MKILKIEDNNGWFFSPGDEVWKKIDQIDKDALMKLLELFLENETSMDKIEADNLSNQAHQIIYKSIFEKFSALEENKSKFKDESERTYYDAIQKYSKLRSFELDEVQKRSLELDEMIPTKKDMVEAEE